MNNLIVQIRQERGIRMVRENKYNRYALWLCSIPGIGSTTIRALMERASGAGAYRRELGGERRGEFAQRGG